MYWDSTYLLVIIGFVISAIASAKVKTTFNKYNKAASCKRYSSQDVALEILHSAGIYDVKIGRIRGSLTDHYSPTEKVLRLSDSVYGSCSIAAIGVAAHECGHAIQHSENYAPLKLRALSVPMANFGSKISVPIIVLGMALGLLGLAKIGIILFMFVVIFQLVTVPVEMNASKRAISILEKRGILYGSELDGATKVLRAAGWTYVAAVLSSILQLFRLIILTQNGKNKR